MLRYVNKLIGDIQNLQIENTQARELLKNQSEKLTTKLSSILGGFDSAVQDKVSALFETWTYEIDRQMQERMHSHFETIARIENVVEMICDYVSPLVAFFTGFQAETMGKISSQSEHIGRIETKSKLFIKQVPAQI